MAEAVVINEPSPLSSANDAAGTIAANRNLKVQQDLQQRQMQQQQQQLDQQAQLNQETISSEKLHDAIDQENNEYQKTVRPIAMQLAQLDIQAKTGAISLQEIQRQAASYTLKIQQADDAYFKKVYGVSKDAAIAKTTLQAQQEQIKASVQQIVASKAEVQQGQERIGIEAGQAGASEAASYATAAEERARASAIQKYGGLTPEQYQNNQTDKALTTQQVQTYTAPNGIIEEYRRNGVDVTDNKGNTTHHDVTDQEIETGIMSSKDLTPEAQIQLLQYLHTHPRKVGAEATPIPNATPLPWSYSALGGDPK